MREVGIGESGSGLEITFKTILEYGAHCKYSDCKHIDEQGCAILAAIETGEIDKDSYDNFMKLEKERMHFESDALERKKKDKDLGKIIKHFKKQRKDNKY